MVSGDTISGKTVSDETDSGGTVSDEAFSGFKRSAVTL